MDYYSDTQYSQVDPYAPPVKRQRPDNGVPLDEVVILKEKVIIPADKYPGYNFVGSILGPQGSILKELQSAVNAKISILGKGSMKDKKKEEEYINSEDEKYAHFKEPLHVLIDIKAPRSEAHMRMSRALVEVYKFMQPQQQQQQQQQQQYNQGPYDAYGGGGGYGGSPRGRGGPPRGRGGPPRGGRGGAPRGGGYGSY